MREYTFGFDISSGEDKTAFSIMKGVNVVCVLEGDTANAVIELFEAERAKVTALSEIIDSQKQSNDALVKRCGELVDSALTRIIEVGEMQTALERIAELEAQNNRLREALLSISRNSCCDLCQEANLVAMKALSTEVS